MSEEEFLNIRLPFPVEFHNGKVGAGCRVATMLLRLESQNRYAKELIARFKDRRQSKPMTNDEVFESFKTYPDFSPSDQVAFVLGVTCAERFHGIGGSDE